MRIEQINFASKIVSYFRMSKVERMIMMDSHGLRIIGCHWFYL